jgi:hypothetical protein
LECFDLNYSPLKNEKRRNRVNTLFTDKRDSMFRVDIDGHGRVESYLKVQFGELAKAKRSIPRSK